MPAEEIRELDVTSLVERLPGAYFRCSCDQQWTLLNITSDIERITGYSPDELIQRQPAALADLFHPDDIQAVRCAVVDALARKRPYSLRYRLQSRSGEYHWCWEQGVGVYDPQGRALYIEGFLTDISEQCSREAELASLMSEQRRELAFNQQLMEQYKKAVDSSSIVSKTDLNGCITYVNDEFCRISGYPREELIGNTHSLVRHPETPDSTFVDMWRTIRAGDVWKGVIKNLNKKGVPYYVNSTMLPVYNDQGVISEFMSVRHDVTDLIEKETLLRRQTTDALTGLPNRQKLLADLVGEKQSSLALINIIDFSEVNEYFGYRTGDRLLQNLAVMLGSSLEDGMRLYRLAGDEFAVLQPVCGPQGVFEQFCLQLIRMVESHGVQVDDQEFSISIAVGAATGENAFIEADIALHSAREHQQSFEVFDGDSRLKQQIESNIRWVKRIRDAIREERIEVYAQPIIDARNGAVAKYECLVRLVDEDGKIYTPYFFLEAAQRARLYKDLTRIVIARAFEFFTGRDEVFSINLSARDILNSETADMLLEQAQRTGVAERLILELVESEGIENYEQVRCFLERARRIGCRIAVDDFGTGYSNFEYLLKLDIDYIKIDGSLIRHVDVDKNARAVAETVVDFARRLGLSTIAEFVHSDAVKAVVEDMGVDYLQGFLLGEPMPLSNIDRGAVVITPPVIPALSVTAIQPEMAE